ncbi:MAG: DNA repair protein RadC [Nitrospina sp.]|nr:DNA repair protein RadC [Nitrospina sp.]
MADSKGHSIKHWPEDERPRERLIKFGSHLLSDAQLVGVVIGTGDHRSNKNAVDLGRDLIQKFGNFYYVDLASVPEISSVRGFGTAKAAQVKAALEMGKRMMAQKGSGSRTQMKTSRDFFEQYAPFMRNLRKEVVKVVLLNPKLHIIKDLTISEGSVNQSIVHPREVMIPAIKESASSIVLLHNHPSGDPFPSSADIEITHRVGKTGEIIGIKLIDHIIIGHDEYYSFADEGLI